MILNFSKWHGLGNDFIIIHDYSEDVFDFNKLAAKICNRNFGVGADGLIAIFSSDKADFKMRIFNSDGSEADMCGNGTRCVAQYLYEDRITDQPQITLETLAGIIRPELIIKNGKVISVKVDMGEPRLTKAQMSLAGDGADKVIDQPLDINGQTYQITCVSMGNPHCVIFVDEINNVALSDIGPLIEKHPMFPYKTNVEFVEVLSKNTVRMRVWERGAGITYACGTGACACLVASFLTGRTDKEAIVKLDGGDLMVKWQENNRLLMTGPATEVFRGVYFVEPA